MGNRPRSFQLHYRHLFYVKRNQQRFFDREACRLLGNMCSVALDAWRRRSWAFRSTHRRKGRNHVASRPRYAFPIGPLSLANKIGVRRLFRLTN